MLLCSALATLPSTLLPVSAEACGPYYATPLLGGYGADPADVPEARFKQEVSSWVERTPSEVRAVLITTGDGDMDDAERLLPPEDLDAYRAARQAVRELDPGLPAELTLYQRGVVAMHAGDLPAARAAFHTLLQLPDEARRYRSTWAAYMLGVLEVDAPQRVQALRRVRSLAAQGHHDTLGLALASLRREVDELPAEAVAERLQACAAYVQGGGSLACADRLDRMADEVLAAPDAHARAAASPAAAAITTLRLTSRGVWLHEQDTHRAEALSWLAQMDTSPHTEGLHGRLAWVAYALDEPEIAQAWIRRAPPEDHVASWIDGKIRVRRGELDAAAAAFERAATSLQAHQSCGHHHRDAGRAVQVELGIVRLAQDRPVDAMHTFLDAGDWMDAAWVGERVLTTDELQALVDARAPAFMPFESSEYGVSGGLPMLLDGGDPHPATLPALLRGLLGRRLVREERLAEARPYLPPSAHPHLDQVIEDLRIGEDASRSDAVRGGALWRAAFTLKMRGWALSATELEPDQRVLGGWYPGQDTEGCRDRTEPWCDEWEGLEPTAGERARRAATGRIEARYHFVHTSDALARRAMALMPDTHPDLPQAACITGHWMAHRDAQKTWDSWLILQNRVPDHPLAQALNGRSGWWELQEDGTCAHPDGSPVEDGVGCATAPAGAGWLGLAVLPLFARRRRRG